MHKKRGKILSFTGNLIFNIIAIGFALVCLFLLLTNFSHKLPTAFDCLIIRVASQSMNPEYERGDVVIIKKTPPEELVLGDVVAFYRYDEKEYSSIIWFHRIIAISLSESGELFFETKGDANQFPDAKLVKQNNVIGVKSIDGTPINQVLEFMISPYGIVVSVIGPSCYIFVYETIILVKIINEKD